MHKARRSTVAALLAALTLLAQPAPLAAQQRDEDAPSRETGEGIGEELLRIEREREIQLRALRKQQISVDRQKREMDEKIKSQKPLERKVPQAQTAPLDPARPDAAAKPRCVGGSCP
ncbi:MAG: hypothetical protein U1E28_03295 [Beijerinckiaceae bacterium]